MFSMAGSRPGRNRRRWGTNATTDQNGNQTYADMSFGNQRPSRGVIGYMYNDQSFDFFAAPGGTGCGSIMFPSNGGYRMVLSGLGGTNNTLGVSLIGPNYTRGVPFAVNRVSSAFCSLGPFVDVASGFTINADTYLQRDAAQNWAIRQNSTTNGSLAIYGDGTNNTTQYNRLRLSCSTAGSATIATEQNGTGTAGEIELRPGTLLSGVTMYNVGTPGATNYERVRMRWNSNVFDIATFAEFGGTGNTTRSIRLLAAGDVMLLGGSTIFSNGAGTAYTLGATNADGVWCLSNNAHNAFQLQFGYSTSSFVSLKGTASTVLQVRLADDSGYGDLTCRSFVTTGGRTVALAAKTGAYTLTATDHVVSVSASSAINITLPTAVGITGQTFTIKRINSSANVPTVNTTSSQTIDGSTTYALSAQWATVTVMSDGANWLILSKI